jgi:hypothetical protein
MIWDRDYRVATRTTDSRHRCAVVRGGCDEVLYVVPVLSGVVAHVA